MEKNSQNNTKEKLINYLQQQHLEIEEIEKLFTLQSFIACISQQFTLPSRLKPKLFRTFKHLLLLSLSGNSQSNTKNEQFNNNSPSRQQPRIDYNKVWGYLTFFTENKLVFLPSQEQWNEFVELISKLILGIGYQDGLELKEKQRMFVEFGVKIINGKRSRTNSALKAFIQQIESSHLLTDLLTSCPTTLSLHTLLKLCLLILITVSSCHIFQSQPLTISTIIEQVYLDDKLSVEQIEFYFNILQILNPLDRPKSTLAKLYFKVSMLMLMQKINQIEERQQDRDKTLREIHDIKSKLKQFLLLNYNLINLNSEIEDNSPIEIKLFQDSLTTAFIIGDNLIQTLQRLIHIDVDDRVLTKIIGTILITEKLIEPLHLLTYCKQNLSFLNKTINKLKQNPSKVLKFIDHDSYFSATISNECQVNFKLKTIKSKDNVVLFELIAKNKRIQIVQKTVDQKFTKIGCFQYVRNEVKCRQIDQLFDFQSTQQFSLYYEKSKVKLHMIRKISESTQNIKLLQIQKFQSIGSKINIGMIQGLQNQFKNIEQLQKFTISSQSIKKDKTQLIQKTNLFKIAIEILQRNSQGMKNSSSNNDMKTYGFKMSGVCVKNYQNDFGLFAEKYNLKHIALRTLKKIINSYFKLTKQSFQYQQNNQHKLHQSLLIAGIKESVQLLKNIQQQRIVHLDDVVLGLIQTFLDNFDRYAVDYRQGNGLLNRVLEVFKIIAQQCNHNSNNKQQSLTMKFLCSVVNCSIPIFICFIDFFQSKFLQNPQQNLKNTLQLFRTIIFQSILLISDPKVFKQQKTNIIEKIDSLLTKFQQNLSHKKLKFDEILDTQETLRFIIGILKNDKYENENHEKMRRYKLSYMLIKFLKNCLNLIKFDTQTEQSLSTSSNDLCLKKIEHLKTLILKDEETSNKFSTTSTEIIVPSKHIENCQNKQELSEQSSSIILSTKQSDLRSGNQALKDKIYILSSYIDLYYTASLFGNQSIQKFETSLEGMLRFINEEEPLISSGFTSEILNKSWIYYFKIFEQQFQQNRAQKAYLNSQHILEKITAFGFQYLSDNTIFVIVKSLVFHPIMFFSRFFDNEKFYDKLTGLDQFILKLVKDLIKKSGNLDGLNQMNLQKTLILLLLRAPIQKYYWMEFETLQLKKILEDSVYLQALQIFILSKILKSQSNFKEQNNEKWKRIFILLLEKNKSFFLDYQSKYVKSQLKNTKLNNQMLALLNCNSEKDFDNNFVKSILQFYEEFLQNFTAIAKTQFETKIQRNLAAIQLQKEKQKQKVQKQQSQKQLKRLLKRDTSAKGLFEKLENKKDLKIQIVKDQQNFRSQQLRTLLNSPLIRKPQKITSEQKILFNHIQTLSSHISFLESGLVETFSQQSSNLHSDKVFLNQKNLYELKKSHQELEFSVDDYCDKNGLRMMLCKKHANKKMPKMDELNKHQQKVARNSFKNTLENLKMIKASAETYSNDLIAKNPDIKSFSKKISDMMPMSPGFRLKQSTQVGQYVDAFKVSLITTSQFHQGQLKVYNYNHCNFVESKDIDAEIYKHLTALEFEQRKKNEIIKNPVRFQIKFDIHSAEYIRRKYLKVDNSVEIFTNNKSYFIVFKNQKQRDNFISKIQEKSEITQQKIHKFTKMWQKGIISNFDYLMELNKFSNRSFNDISQYYVFPWTVIDSKCKVINDDFMKNPKNLRDLKKPIGKINDEKFAKIKSNFESTKKFAKSSNRQLFLYSSFYSNPAIVSYYLIRLYPFSAHQYELQSQHFDQADRLFGSIENNYNAVYRIAGDFKELIPQFYCNPYFLKNLNRYDFGMTQDKVLINDVKLPDWVKTQTPQEFIFRMRKVLQSFQVTQNLHNWIDLTFGICADKNKAEKYDNLYNENIYGQNLDNENLDFINKYLKQFGQIPCLLFQTQHPKSLIKMPDTRKMLKKSKSLTDILKQQFLKQQIKQFTFNECQRLKYDTEQNIIKFNRKNVQKDQKDLMKMSLTSVRSIKMYDNDNSQADQMSFLLLKENILVAKNISGFGYFSFAEDNKDPFDYKNRPQLSTISKCAILTIQDSKNLDYYFLTIENTKLFGHKLSFKSNRGWKNSIGDKFPIQINQQLKSIKTINSYLIVVTFYDEVKLFHTNKAIETSALKHKKTKSANDYLVIDNTNLTLCKTIKFQSSEIEDIEINEYLSILSVRLGKNQFVVFDVRDQVRIDIRVCFKIQLNFKEKIIKVEIHNMGYFLILTNKNRFVLVNLLGEIVLNIIISFESEFKMNKKEEQTITTACFWSQQSSTILFSTNIGILYKIDLFDMAQKRSIKQNRLPKQIQTIKIDEFQIFSQQNDDLVDRFQFKGQQKIVDIKIERRGRHWKIYCLGRKGNIYTLKNKYFDLAKL